MKTLLEQRINDGVISLDNMSLPKLYSMLETVEDFRDRDLIGDAIIYHKEQRRHTYADNAAYCLL